MDCFWNAYALFETGQTGLKEAIEEYKRVMIIMTKEAKNII